MQCPRAQSVWWQRLQNQCSLPRVESSALNTVTSRRQQDMRFQWVACSRMPPRPRLSCPKVARPSKHDLWGTRLKRLFAAEHHVAIRTTAAILQLRIIILPAGEASHESGEIRASQDPKTEESPGQMGCLHHSQESPLSPTRHSKPEGLQNSPPTDQCFSGSGSPFTTLPENLPAAAQTSKPKWFSAFGKENGLR